MFINYHQKGSSINVNSKGWLRIQNNWLKATKVTRRERGEQKNSKMAWSHAWMTLVHFLQLLKILRGKKMVIKVMAYMLRLQGERREQKKGDKNQKMGWRHVGMILIHFLQLIWKYLGFKLLFNIFWCASTAKILVAIFYSWLAKITIPILAG